MGRERPGAMIDFYRGGSAPRSHDTVLARPASVRAPAAPRRISGSTHWCSPDFLPGLPTRHDELALPYKRGPCLII